MQKRGRKPLAPPTSRPDWAIRLAEERIAAGHSSQERFSGLLGKSQSAYGAYETGESEPDLATWRRIAKALNLSPAWLAFGTGSRAPGDGDSELWRAFEAHQDDARLAEAIHQLCRMLAEEQFSTNPAFIFKLGIKIARAAQGIEDHLEARKLISLAVERERMEIREGLEKLRKSLL